MYQSNIVQKCALEFLLKTYFLFLGKETETNLNDLLAINNELRIKLELWL